MLKLRLDFDLTLEFKTQWGDFFLRIKGNAGTLAKDFIKGRKGKCRKNLND